MVCLGYLKYHHAMIRTYIYIYTYNYVHVLYRYIIAVWHCPCICLPYWANQNIHVSRLMDEPTPHLFTGWYSWVIPPVNGWMTPPVVGYSCCRTVGDSPKLTAMWKVRSQSGSLFLGGASAVGAPWFSELSPSHNTESLQRKPHYGWKSLSWSVASRWFSMEPLPYINAAHQFQSC